MSKYHKVLQRELDKATKNPATGLSINEVNQRIAAINEQLKGPLSNVERIMLCADRAELKAALVQ